MNKNILVISYSPLDRDPRIQRQICALKENCTIQTVGFTNPNVEGVDFFEIQPSICKNLLDKVQRALRILFHFYKMDLAIHLSMKKLFSYNYKIPDAIIANDWDGLYAAFLLKRNETWNCKIYFDSHEYFPECWNSLFFKIFEKPLINFVFKETKNSFDIISTVCPTLAQMYDDYFHLPKGTVRIVTNAPDYEQKLKPKPVGEKLRLIHHGGAMRARQLEKMIDMMQYLPEDKYELNFMLVKSDPLYYDELVKRASKYKNIIFLEPVPFSQIPEFTNQFDVGLFILNNKITNYKYALPNKFFEYVQARLAIAIGDSFEMKQYIKKYQLGIAADDNSAKALADKLLQCTKEDIMNFKNNSDKYAKELSAESNIAVLKEIAKQLTE